MSLAPGFSVSQSEWISILTWREANPHLSDRQVRDHFALSSNGPIQFSLSALGRRWKQWKELRKTCGEGEQPAFEIRGNRALRDAEWVEVFEFVDRFPGWKRDRVVEHFEEMGLKFSKHTLSSKLRKRARIETSVGKVASGSSKGKGKAKGKVIVGGRAVSSRSSIRSATSRKRVEKSIPSDDARAVPGGSDDSATAAEVADTLLGTREASIPPLHDPTPPHPSAPTLPEQENTDPVLLDLSNNSASVIVTLSERVKTYGRRSHRGSRGNTAPYILSGPMPRAPKRVSGRSASRNKSAVQLSSQRNRESETKRLVSRSRLWENWLP